MDDRGDEMPAFNEKLGELVGKNGEDYVIISAEALRRINRQEEMMLGTGSFVIWYNAGKAVGRTDGQRYAPLMRSMEIEAFAVRVRDIYSRYGWGSIQFRDVDPKSGELVFWVKNSPLARGVRSKEPRCYFVRGFVEGMISELLGTEVVAVEVSCETVTGQHCEFRLRWEGDAVK